MAQFAYPDGDITNPANVTGTYLDIDEGATSDDSDYIYGTNNSTDVYECSLDNVTDPNVHTGHIVRWRQAQADSDAGTPAPSSGGNNSTLDVLLIQGTTIIGGSTAISANEGSFAAGSFTLSAAEASNITDYTDLRVRIQFNGSGGNPNSRRSAAVSWVELEVPDVVASTRRIVMVS